jgi:hypothetical protein
MDWLVRYADPTLDWSYALVTLVVRFAGVFVVMLVMQAALQVAAAAVARIERRRRRAAPPPPAAARPRADAGLDDDVVAAIGLALALEGGGAPTAPSPRVSPWVIAGRMESLAPRPLRRR